MAEWVLQDWGAGDDCFVIPGPASGATIYSRFQTFFPDDALVELIDASGIKTTAAFRDLPRLSLELGGTAVLPGIPVAAGPLLYVMERLLGPEGCPWDKIQTSESLLRYLLDESYEAAEALIAQDNEAFAEELGDVLLQVAFHGALLPDVTFAEIARQQAQKLVRRHPHVFSHESWDNPDEVRRQWEELKAQEPAHEGAALWAYPALVAAKRLGKRGISPQSEVYQEFLALLKVYCDQGEGKIEEILADAAWAAAAVGRLYHQDAEWALWKKVARTARENGDMSSQVR